MEYYVAFEAYQGDQHHFGLLKLTQKPTNDLVQWAIFEITKLDRNLNLASRWIELTKQEYENGSGEAVRAFGPPNYTNADDPKKKMN